MLLFLCDRTEYGVVIKEKVHVYECTGRKSLFCTKL